MKSFRGKGSEPLPADNTGKGEGYAAGNVTIFKTPQGRRVEILLIDCGSGDVLFKANYRTHLKSDFAAYEDAKAKAKAYLDDEGLFLLDALTTNADLPIVKSHLKGGRW